MGSLYVIATTIPCRLPTARTCIHICHGSPPCVFVRWIAATLQAVRSSSWSSPYLRQDKASMLVVKNHCNELRVHWVMVCSLALKIINFIRYTCGHDRRLFELRSKLGILCSSDDSVLGASRVLALRCSIVRRFSAAKLFAQYVLTGDFQALSRSAAHSRPLVRR